MIDRVMGRYAAHRYAETDADYSASQAVVSTRLMNERANSLTVLFPPWRGGKAVYDVLTRRLVKNGSAVLRYAFHPQVLEPRASRVLDSFEYIQQRVTHDIRSLQDTNGYSRVDFIGSSLGCVSLGLVAQSYSDFDSATMVVAGSDLARGVWHGSRTGAIRDELREQGMTRHQLAERWAPLAPKLMAPALVGKDVRMIASSTDRVIPALQQAELANAVLLQNRSAEIQWSHAGHIASVVRFCIAGPLPGAPASV